MFKLVVLSAVLALAAAAPAPAPVFIGGPTVVGAYPGAYHAPVLSAPIVKAAVPVATSYANTYRVPGPVAYAAPAYHAPVLAASAYHAPLAYSSPLAHTFIH